MASTKSLRFRATITKKQHLDKTGFVWLDMYTKNVLLKYANELLKNFPDNFEENIKK